MALIMLRLLWPWIPPGPAPVEVSAVMAPVEALAAMALAVGMGPVVRPAQMSRPVRDPVDEGRAVRPRLTLRREPGPVILARAGPVAVPAPGEGVPPPSCPCDG